MVKHLILTNYTVLWELKYSPNYKFTKRGICINTKTGRIIKKTLNGGSIGYCINGKFRSLKYLRPQLVKIKHIDCPF